MSVSIEDINLSNDLVFSEVMRQPENVKPFLEAVLEKKIADIAYIEKQQDVKADKVKVERLMTLAAKIGDARFYARKEALEEGRAEGEHSAMVGLVKRLLKQQRSLEDISDICGLDLDEIKKIAEDE